MEKYNYMCGIDIDKLQEFLTDFQANVGINETLLFVQVSSMPVRYTGWYIRGTGVAYITDKLTQQGEEDEEDNEDDILGALNDLGQEIEE